MTNLWSSTQLIEQALLWTLRCLNPQSLNGVNTWTQKISTQASGKGLSRPSLTVFSYMELFTPFFGFWLAQTFLAEMPATP